MRRRKKQGYIDSSTIEPPNQTIDTDESSAFEPEPNSQELQILKVGDGAQQRRDAQPKLYIMANSKPKIFVSNAMMR